MTACRRASKKNSSVERARSRGLGIGPGRRRWRSSLEGRFELSNPTLQICNILPWRRIKAHPPMPQDLATSLLRQSHSPLPCRRPSPRGSTVRNMPAGRTAEGDKRFLLG